MFAGESEICRADQQAGNSWPGIDASSSGRPQYLLLRPSAVRAQNPNHCTARESPSLIWGSPLPQRPLH